MKLKVAAIATIGPTQIYELHSESGRFYGFVNAKKLKEKGLVKRVDHCKKAEEFFNTADGLQWVNENRFFNVV